MNFPIASATQDIASAIQEMDAQAAEIVGMQVPAVDSGNVQSDVANLRQEAGKWPTTLRPQVMSALLGVIDCSSQFQQENPDLPSLTGDQLAAAIAQLQQKVGWILPPLSSVLSSLGSYQSSLSIQISALATDQNAVASELSGDQAELQSLQQQESSEQADIQAVNGSTLDKIGVAVGILTGNSTPLLAMEEKLASLVDQANQTGAQIASLEQQTNALQALTTAIGPLDQSASSLSGGLTGLQMAINETANTLSQIQNTATNPAIVLAQAETIAQDLQQAAQIAQNIQGAS